VGVDLTGAILDGRYRVIEPIAEGAMGVVYRAERVKLGRIVAVKVMHESLPAELSSRQRFEIEAMAMSKLDHPHCAAVLDVGVHEERPFVVMDFVSGDNLKDLLDGRVTGGLPIVRVVEIMRQVLSGLAHAHELGIVHRDIKPANIVLSQKAGLGDHVKILDFGLARLHDAPQGMPTLTVGLVVGTPSYMAPEQCTGQGVDARTDVYACGVMLFELLTGTKPFVSQHDDPVEVVRMHIQQMPPTLAEASGQEFGPELEAVVARALAKKPEDRYASATAFAAELEGIRAMLISAPIRAANASLALPTGSDTVRDPEAVVPGELPPLPASDRHAVRQPTEGLPMDFAGLNVATLPAPTPSPDQPIAWIPLDRKQLKIAGGVLGGLLLLVIIAVAASGGKPAATWVDAGVAKATPDAMARDVEVGADPEGDLLTRAQAMIDSKKTSQALDLLTKGRAVFPGNAQMAYLAGRLYFDRLFWNDGLAAFRAAIKLDAAYRSDPELIKTVLRGFLVTPSYNGDLATFLRNDIGELAAGFLEEAARSHPQAGTRARAASELKRYR